MSDENFPIPRLFLAATLTLYRWYGYNFGNTIPPKDLEKLSAVVNTVWITCSKGLLFREERLVLSKSFKCSVLLLSYGVQGTENKNIIFVLTNIFQNCNLLRISWFKITIAYHSCEYIEQCTQVLEDHRPHCYVR